MRDDRPEDRLIPGASADGRKLLQTLHIMNADGSVSADMRRKLNQVTHLVELFRPVLAEIAARRRSVRILDANCGNSYLGFLLYHHAATQLGVPVSIHGIDRSPDRIAACRSRARDLAYSGMSFSIVPVAQADLAPDYDLLLSLHGCDTATDDAIRRGVALGIPHIHVVPCCQKEVRPLLREDGRFAPFLHDGIIANDFAATLTDVLRALWLRAQGYRAEIVEFVPLEHSMKNRLIRAKFTRRRDGARQELDALLAELTAPPAIARGSPATEETP